MTIKRYDVMAPALSTGWVPATLILDTDSSRGDTLKVTVHGTRGQGEILFRGESFAEANAEIERSKYNPPKGYTMVQLRLERDVYMVASIMAPEILQGARQLRRGRPRTPISRFANDEIHQCVACGWRVMSRGSDHEGWKGIQMRPEDLDHDYYCTKPACIDRRDEAIEQAKINWGMVTSSPISSYVEAVVPATVAATASTTVVPKGAVAESAEGAATGPKYGPPADKPFL